MEKIIITFENGTKKEYPKGIKLSEIIESVKENIDKFNLKTITLTKANQGKLYVDNIK